MIVTENMLKKTFLAILAIGIALVITVLLIFAFWFMERQARHQRQYQLLCEELVFGMSEDEVLNILLEKGSFKKRYYESQQLSVFDIWYIDFDSQKLYGDFGVYFWEKEYFQAARPAGASDFYGEIICTRKD